MLQEVRQESSGEGILGVMNGVTWKGSCVVGLWWGQDFYVPSERE